MAQSIPNGDREFFTWFQNFSSALEEFTSDLGITPAEYDQLSGFFASFSVALSDMENKRAQAKAATQAKDAVRDNAEDFIRAIIRRIQAHPNTTDAMRARLGITIPESTRSSSSPAAPVNLIAVRQPDGSVRLDWDANGNGRVIYVIEIRRGNTGDFTMLDISTRQDYIHTGLPMSETAAYRVRAQHNDERSAPSNVAMVGM